jgi:putative heme-binding domain-containing protein
MELNRLLESFSDTTDESVGLAFVAALKESRARSSVRVDLLRQRLAQFSASVQDAGQELLVWLNVDPAEQNARLNRFLAELTGLRVDVRRGQLVFNSQQTACATCHTIGYLGGKVGPDLTSIGQIRTERDLLEAVLYPSASFVRSFEPVIVTTKDGEEYSGVVTDETADELVLTVGADSRVRVSKVDLAELRPGTVSVMPTGLDEQLSKQELADLLAFLKNTRWGPQ